MFETDLKLSKRPGILVGGGAYKARDDIEIYARIHSIPVFRTWNALDVITDDSLVFGGTVGTYGGAGRNFGIQNCDLLLVLGCRISGRITGGMPETFARGAKIYVVDVDEHLLNPEFQPRKADVNILMDCGEYVKSLPQAQTDFFSGWMGQCREWVKKYDPVKPEHHENVHHYGVMRRFSELLPNNAIVVSDTGGNAIMMGHCFKSKKGQRIFSSNGNSAMGFSMCGAMGAWFADPTRPVYCVIGDGGMNMNLQELQTLVNYGCEVKTIILNNHILGNTKSWQRVNGRAELACGPDGYHPPDFIGIGHAYHIPSHFYVSEYQLSDLIKRDGPWILDVVHHDFCTYEPRMSYWDRGIEEMYPPLSHEEFKANMFIDPLEGWEDREWR